MSRHKFLHWLENHTQLEIAKSVKKFKKYWTRWCLKFKDTDEMTIQCNIQCRNIKLPNIILYLKQFLFTKRYFIKDKKHIEQSSFNSKRIIQDGQLLNRLSSFKQFWSSKLYGWFYKKQLQKWILGSQMHF